MGDVIDYKNRSDFEQAFGHAVTPDRHVQSLKKSKLSHIPHADFYEFLEHLFDTHAINEYEQNRCYEEANKLLGLHTHSHDNDNDGKNSISAQCAELYDDILCGLDKRLINLAYFIKINAFMPLVARHFGGHYNYTASLSEGGHLLSTIYFHDLMKVETIQKHIEQAIETGYDYLGALRLKFSSADQLSRLNHDRMDDFCREFLNNNEIDRMFAHDRLEYQFFRHHGIPLGIFNTSPLVSQYLAKARRSETYVKAVETQLCETGHMKGYPGLMPVAREKSGIIRDNLRRNLCRDLRGPIPITGLKLG